MKYYDIFHIYYGTQGTAGLYLDEIYKSLDSAGYSQKVFVSYYFPFNYGDKIFYRFSDISHGIKHQSLRKLIRYIELYIALLLILFQVIKHKPKIINYSFFTYFFPERMFFKLVKMISKSKICLTCHDVVPFFINTPINNVIRARRNIFNKADYLFVHNNNSIHELKTIYSISENKILNYPFPLMDLRSMKFDLSDIKTSDFAFIGHLRREKGINILLNAWKKFHDEFNEAKLLISGNHPGFITIDINYYKSMNVIFNLHYTNDLEYCQNIRSTHCVILPYERGTNSGIPSSVFSLDTDLIVSDIPMFVNNSLIPKESFFITNNSESLYQVMRSKYLSSFYHKNSKKNLENYRNDFMQKTIAVYENLLRGK